MKPMFSLDDLLAPIGRRQFDDEFNDRQPLYIPAEAGGSKRALLDWAGFNRLLDQASNWTAQSLKLVHNGEPIPPETYCVQVQTQSGSAYRPSPARVQTLLASGASLVAGDVHALTPELSAASRALAEHFAGLCCANVYCSFGGVQAFNTHFDPHHVLAVQVEGEKTWRLYANRADAPVELPQGVDNPREWFAAHRGPLKQELRMRPGDVLYLPRGWYHDALATEGASLHVTFGITPLYGRILFRLLESAAMQDPAFRAWLRPAREDGGAGLRDQLKDLGQRLARLTAQPAFLDEVAMAQERLIPRDPAYDLPNRTRLTYYRPTGLLGPAVEGPGRIALEWALGQRQVALEDMIAQFDFIPPDALREAIEAAVAAGALTRAP